MTRTRSDDDYGLTPSEAATHLMVEDPTDPDSVDYVDFVADHPVPLERESETKPFPFFALPKPYGAFTNALSESTQTDPAMVGVTALGALSAALGGYVQVQVKDDYIEPTHIWTAVIAAPGERKSAVMRPVFGPLHDVERDLHEEVAPVLAEQAVQRDVAERAAEKAKRDAGNAANPDQRNKLTSEASTLATQAAGMTVAAPPRILGDDVTPEALVSHLAEQGGRFTLASAEGGGFFTALSGRYSDKTVVSPVLAGHGGDRMRVDRKGRESEFVDNPALTVALMIQPGVLATATANRAFTDSGLMARFLYSWPPSSVGRRDVDPDPVPSALAREYADALYKLAYGARKNGGTRTLTLSPEARTARLGYAKTVEQDLGPGGALSHMAGWGSKVVGASVRIAGLLHAATEDQLNIISGDTMDAAILLAKYFTSHASRVFDGLSAGATDRAKARQVLDLIRRRDMDDFTVRDLMQLAARSWLPDTETAQQAVDMLQDLGWVMARKPELRTGPGRKPAIRYRSHPAIWETETPPHNPHNPQNPDYVDYVDYVEPPQAPYDDVPRCPTHRTIIGSTGRCVECITENAAIKISNQEHAA